jgi:hypothetical protein
MIPIDYPNIRVHQVSITRPSDEQIARDLSKLMTKHPKVFDGVCRVMDCEPVHLTLREGAIPVQIRGYRNIAEPLIQMFKDELMSQVEQGLVRPVPPGAVTPFISGVVTMPKTQYQVASAPRSTTVSSTNGSSVQSSPKKRLSKPYGRSHLGCTTLQCSTASKVTT